MAQVLRAFAEVVGREHLATGDEQRRPYENTTFPTTPSVVAVVRPANTNEVQACVRVANRFGTPIYPISTGKNTGYGSRVPTADGSIVLELSRMNRVLAFNEDLAYATVEPGVTQRQMFLFLQQKGSRLWMDATGGTEHHSLIGNIVERGFGHTPYGDHFAHVAGLEVVLPNGDRLHTGFGRFGNASATPVYRWGVGPFLDGLFTQSNLGIITSLTVWLMPAPPYTQSFYFSVERHDQLGEVVDLLRPLRLDGTLRSAMHIGNDYKVLSSIQPYPWKRTDGKRPLPRTLLAEYAKSWDFGAWNGSGALYGTRTEVGAARRRVKRALRGRVKRLRFLDDRRIRLAGLIQRPYAWLTGVNLPEMLRIIKPVYGLVKGVPTDEMLPSCYWRKNGPYPAGADADPDRDRCGLLWCAPIAPTEGRHATAIWQITERIFARYGFEPAIAITLLTERSLDCVISICYDRDVPGEDEQAMNCHDELLSRLTEAGYYPYRLGLQSMQGLPPQEEGYLKAIRAIKKALDPNGILAPGRYDFTR
jgi:4-cresol dehydrogenase (hydroxylating)